MPFTIRPRVRRAFRLALRRRDLTDDEIDEELRFHIEMRVAQLVARGMPRAHAEREARLRFGDEWDAAVARLHDAGHQREERLDMRERWDALRRDVAYAVRTLGRQPGFAAMVIITFALGIGANATMFGIIDRLLLRPPPHVHRPEEVMAAGMLYEYQGGEHFGGGMAYPLYTALKRDTLFFRGAAVSDVGTFTLGRGLEAEQITGALVSADYFDMLGIRPLAGRFILASEGAESGGTPVAVLSYGFWQRRFGGERSVLGRRIRIGPNEYTVVGIAPRGFTGPEPRAIDVWVPVAAADGLRIEARDWATTWDSFWAAIYVRLQPGVTSDAAAARARTLYLSARASWLASMGRPTEQTPPRMAMRSILPAKLLGNRAEARIARLLAIVAGLVLVIASANVANLLLARGADRRREIAIRLALGVSRARLLRLLIAETAVLALAGGVVALIAAVWGVRLIHATMLEDFAWIEATVDGRVLAATGVLVALATAIAGLVPAMHASRPNVTESLKAGGREGSVHHSRVRSTLLVVQAAVSVLLLVGAGLFVRSMRQVAAHQLGYEPERVIAATMDVKAIGYNAADRTALFTAMRERVAALPGVEYTAISSTHPLRGSAYGMQVEVPGRDSLPKAATGGPYFNAVSGDYFATLGLRVIDGRPIADSDVGSSAPVAMLSAAMARAYWPGESAVGRCIRLNGDSTCTTIIGVAEDAKEQVRAGPPRFLVYMRSGSGWDSGRSIMLVRSQGGDPALLVASIRRAMQSVAPDLPYAEVRTFEEMLAPQIRSWRMGATLFGVFGAMALLIAAVGLYAAIAYSVAQRGHEFGVRMALGAGSSDVVRLVMLQGVRTAILGVVAGTVVALFAGRFIASLLFETSPRNPQVFAAVGVVMLLVTAAATFIPAWRASRADPVRALRGE